MISDIIEGMIQVILIYIFIFGTLKDDFKKYSKIKYWFYEKTKYDENLKEIYDDYIDKTKIKDFFNKIILESFFCNYKNQSYNYMKETFIILNIIHEDSLFIYFKNYNNKSYRP